MNNGISGLVRVACRERDLLRRKLAPHLVQPLPFLFPVYQSDPVGYYMLKAGMWLYDVLATMKNIKRHKMMRADKVLGMEPGLRADNLRGAALYYDAFTDDARLTFETALAAHSEGAVLANYVQLNGLTKEAGRIVGAEAQDVVDGRSFEISADCVVNTAGPWADEVRKMDDPSVEPCLRLTKGVHIVVPRKRIGNNNAVVMRSAG